MIWLNRISIFTVVLILLCSYSVPCKGQEVGDRISVTGKIDTVKISNFGENSWKELAVRDQEGNVYILIGEKAGKAGKMKGKKVKIEGIAKHKMMYNGKKRSVIEVKKAIRK